jgi:hypothetical protein
VEEVSPAYGAEMWHELYVMVGGAAGALAGLLFVAVSINLDRIINQKYLPRRAAETLAIMVGLLVLAVLVLVPQSVLALGIETVVLGLVIILIMIGRLRVPPTAGQSVLLHYVPAVILALFGLPLMAGAISLLVGVGGGLYWFVPAVVLGFAGAVLNAWVLLIEILR